MSAFTAGLGIGLGFTWLTAAAPGPTAKSDPAPALRVDSFARVARDRARSVVFIHTMSRDPAKDQAARPFVPGAEAPEIVQPIEEGLGSGVVIESSGLILTNAHVIEGADVIHVRTPDGDDVDAAVVGVDPTTDLALLRAADPSGLMPAPLGDSDRVNVGDWVLAIGHPFGLHHTVTAGIISAKARAEVLPQLRTGTVTHGWIGVATMALSPRGARAMGLVAASTHPLMVTAVLIDGPASLAGIRVGDVLLGIAGDRAVPARDIHRRVQTLSPGAVIRLRVSRGGQETSVPVRVGTRPPRE